MSELHFSMDIQGIQELCTDVATSIHGQFHVAVAVVVKDWQRKPHIYQHYREEQNEVLRRKAIELAVNFRIMDERLSEAKAWRFLRDEIDQQFQPGAFIVPEPAPLPLRECCNKLVHAKGFRFGEALFTSQGPAGEVFSNRTYDSEVRLFGDRSGKPWECEVDLLKLAESIFEALERWVQHDFQPMANE